MVIGRLPTARHGMVGITFGAAGEPVSLRVERELQAVAKTQHEALRATLGDVAAHARICSAVYKQIAADACGLHERHVAGRKNLQVTGSSDFAKGNCIGITDLNGVALSPNEADEVVTRLSKSDALVARSKSRGT